MNLIRTFFIKAKHWQLFILIFLLPQVAGIVGMVSTGPTAMAVAMMAFTVAFLAWFGSIGSFLSSRLRTPSTSNPNVFAFALMYPLLYGPVFFWFTIRSNQFPPILVLLHLLAMACMFYLLNFVAKNLVTVETGKEAFLSDYLGVFILFWFFPIGIWVIQPKMNRLYVEAKAAPNYQ